MAFKILLPAILFLLGLVSSDNLADVNEAVVLAEGVEKLEPLSNEKRGLQFVAGTGSYITTDPVESSSFKRSSSSIFQISRSGSNTGASASFHESLDDFSSSVSREAEGLDLAEPESLDLAEGVEKHEPLSREKRGVQYDADTGSYITTSEPVESSSFKRSSSSNFPTSRSVSNSRASASYHQR